MKFKIPKLSFSSMILFLFMIIGYLESGWIGVFAGFLFWSVCNLLLPVSLVPFAGFFLYQWLTNPFFSNVTKFLSLGVLLEKCWLLYGVMAIIYCVLTSVLTVIGVAAGVYYWRNKQVKRMVLTENLKEFSDFVKLLNWRDIKELVNTVQLKLNELKQKVNMKIIGSVLYWLGIGVASHDFWWECEEYQVDAERPTHGMYLGLNLASVGISLVESNVFSNLIHYLGYGFCFLAFNLLTILPRGPSRWIAHFFWWAGVGLMSFNWYQKMRGYIFKSESLTGEKEVLEVLKTVRQK
ncbi:MAG: hypothetical protein ACPLKS_04775 [Caldisericum exile]|uniref:hypothetical protein n=1 Tax=Caldisericum exile TaxID=693075 RepID=UPI003C75802C